MQFKSGYESQCLQWQIFEEKSGLIVAEGEQHNLVLTNASNLMPVHGIRALTTFAAVGTSSSAPAVGQTALGAQLVRTSFVPSGDADSLTRVSNGVYDVRRVRQFTAAEVGGQNLTEWGFAPTNISTLSHRELFRDGGNNPVTITPTITQALRLIKTDRITLGPIPAAPVSSSINIAGIGSRSGKLFISSGIGPNPIADLVCIEALIQGNGNIGFLGDALLPSYGGYAPLGSAKGMNSPAYTPNSKTRQTGTYFLSNAEAIGSIYGFGIEQPSDGSGPGVYFAFDAGQQIVKNGLNELTINPWSVSWT